MGWLWQFIQWYVLRCDRTYFSLSLSLSFTTTFELRSIDTSTMCDRQQHHSHKHMVYFALQKKKTFIFIFHLKGAWEIIGNCCQRHWQCWIKMKVKVISRNPDEYMRETKRDIHRLKRNYDPSLHPLEGQRKFWFDLWNRFVCHSTGCYKENVCFFFVCFARRWIRACIECHKIGSCVCEAVYWWFGRPSWGCVMLC